MQTNFSSFSYDNSRYDYTVTDIAVDDYGHVYMAHDGTSAEVWNGGVLKIFGKSNASINYGLEANLPGHRINSIEIDANDRMWVVNNFHQIKHTGLAGIFNGSLVVAPGAIAYRDSGDLIFKSYGGWYTKEGELNAHPTELPYPAETRQVGFQSLSQQTRNMRAISTDENFVWIGCAGYVPANDLDTFISSRILLYGLNGGLQSVNTQLKKCILQQV